MKKRSNKIFIIIAAVVIVLVIALTAIFYTPIKEYLSFRTALNKMADKYEDLKLTDVHNHDARKYKSMVRKWNSWNVHRVVLFGNISEPAAVKSDEQSWDAYMRYPHLIVPYFSGFDLNDESCIEVINKNLSQGYFGVGETVAASEHSPTTEGLVWKAKHPMAGYLPQVYDICAQYNAPILLHIDPPYGEAIENLELALLMYPDTIFIYAHMNAYSSPEFIFNLMSEYENLHIDFFAGFTMYNPDSEYELLDFVHIANTFSDRFLLSTDSGYGLESEAHAVYAMYSFLDLIEDASVREKIAYKNYDAMIQAQPITDTQIRILDELDVDYDAQSLNKFEAGKLIAVSD